ncbi:MAG: acetate--CoA ligase family protein [archaeon]
MKEMNYLKAMELLESYDIPVVESSYMTKETQSAQKASEVGFPLVMKIDCTEPIHKSDEGYVKTDITSVDELEDTYVEMKEKAEKQEIGFQGVVLQRQIKGKEVIIGGKRDPQFGPIVLFGQGGIFVEVFKDTSIRVAPIEKEEAMKMIKEIKTHEILMGTRGEEPVDVEKLAEIISKTSELIWENEEILEMDLNPVIVNSDEAKAVDLRIITKGEVNK